MQQMLPETGRQTEVGHFCFCFSFSWIYSLRWRLCLVDFGFEPDRLSRIIWQAHDVFGSGALLRRQRCRLITCCTP
ncbi:MULTISPECIES: hypothetical protein [Burkholderiaceae]|uniref:hypothetical protein n=1 Tax=Burkholderia pseudomallei TaxID=28450 RepID=UPI0012F4D8FE|nr:MULTISPECIES: hypothetical protein [Burkholderiaceae]